MGDLFERNGLISERSESSLVTQAVLNILRNELSLLSQVKHGAILMQDNLRLLSLITD